MSDINWDLAPEGAVELKETAETGYLRWFNEKGQAYGAYGWFPARDHFETIATRPQSERKTVEDAVEYYKSNFPEGPAILGIAFSNDKIVPFHRGCPIADGTNSSCSYIICTREEFEDFVAAKSEAEWTHEYRLGDSQCWFPCSIVTEVGTQGVVIKCDVFEGVQYCSYNGRQAIELKPIKPTITKSEAWDKLTKLNGKYQNMDTMTAIMTLCDEHEVVE